MTYAGSQSGVLYTREIRPTRQYGGGVSGPLEEEDGRFFGSASSTGCWEHTAPRDEPGGVLEAWVDRDGDDAERCGCADGGLGLCGLEDFSACGPEPEDPQGRAEYTLKAHGLTTVVLELSDDSQPSSHLFTPTIRSVYAR